MWTYQNVQLGRAWKKEAETFSGKVLTGKISLRFRYYCIYLPKCTIAELANKTSGFQRYAYIGMMSAKNNLSDRHWTDGSPFDFTAWEKYKPQDVSYDVDGCGITYPMSESRPNTWDDWPCETNTSWTASAAVCKLPANTVLATNDVDPYFFMA